MKTVFEPAYRQQLHDRVARLDPRAAARWGRMTAPDMVCHLLESARMCLEELPVAPKRVPLRFFPLKQIAIYWAPMPKGLPTAPELVARRPADWDADVTALHAALDRVAARPVDSAWCAHPAFGPMSGRQWGVLVYRHSDHHLRQFGV